MDSKTEFSSRDPEDIQMEALGANILAQIGGDKEYLPTLSEYLDVAQTTAKVGILFTVFEEILRSGFSPDELVQSLSRFSYRWGCESATFQIENASTDLAIFLRKKAAQESTESRPE